MITTFRRDRRRFRTELEPLDDRAVPAPAVSGLPAQHAAALHGRGAARQAQIRRLRAHRMAARHRLVAAPQPVVPVTPTSSLPSGPAALLAASDVAGPAASVATPTPSSAPVVGPIVVNAETPDATPNDDPIVAMEKAGGPLQDLYSQYAAYVAAGSQGNFQPTGLAAGLRIEGTRVAVDVRVAGDVAVGASTLAGLGLNVEQTDAGSRTVEGTIEISRLPDLAASNQAITIAPIYRPILGG